jgi:hypothetical protein
MVDTKISRIPANNKITINLRRATLLPVKSENYEKLINNILNMELLKKEDMLLMKTLNEIKLIEIIMIYNEIVGNLRLKLERYHI